MDTHTISWHAPLYDHRAHSADWYWAVGIIAVSLAVAFFIVGNALLSIIVLVGIGTLLVHAKTPPEMVECELSRKGIRMSKTLYPWESLESFWIIEEHRTDKEHLGAKLLLISQKPFMPHIVVPLGDTPVDEVRQTLTHMLPEVPQVEPLPDRLMRKLGF